MCVCVRVRVCVVCVCMPTRYRPQKKPQKILTNQEKFSQISPMVILCCKFRGKQNFENFENFYRIPPTKKPPQDPARFCAVSRCCSVLQWVAVCVAVCRIVTGCCTRPCQIPRRQQVLRCVAVCCGVLQCVLRGVAVRYSALATRPCLILHRQQVLQCVAVCCSVCCRLLQCVTVC